MFVVEYMNYTVVVDSFQMVMLKDNKVYIEFDKYNYYMNMVVIDDHNNLFVDNQIGVVLNYMMSLICCCWIILWCLINNSCCWFIY